MGLRPEELLPSRFELLNCLLESALIMKILQFRDYLVELRDLDQVNKIRSRWYLAKPGYGDERGEEGRFTGLGAPLGLGRRENFIDITEDCFLNVLLKTVPLAPRFSSISSPHNCLEWSERNN